MAAESSRRPLAELQTLAAGQQRPLAASGGVACLMRMMTEGVWAMAPIMLHTQMTHRKVRKASWQPGLGHFPGNATASSLLLDTHVQPVRF